jgi:hypothetical protein
MSLQERKERIRAINRAPATELPTPQRVDLICNKLALYAYGPAGMKVEG